MVNKVIYILCFFYIITGCTNRETPVDKQKLLAGDYRIFQGTIAWELAKAVQDQDIDKIKRIQLTNKGLIDYSEPRYGQTLLALSIINLKFDSFKTLIELHANPNVFNLYDGETPLMKAADIGLHEQNIDSRYLSLLLRNGANPNLQQRLIENKGATIKTPLLVACSAGTLEYVKILVNAGSNINYVSEYGENALYSAILSENVDIVIYLIQKGADFKMPMFTNANGKKQYITDALRFWHFELGSEKYKKKMFIVNFLKNNGLDYRKAKIPKFYYDQYDEQYLEKY